MIPQVLIEPTSACNIYHADFVDCLNEIPDNSISAIIYDEDYDEHQLITRSLPLLLPKLRDDGTIFVFTLGYRKYMLQDASRCQNIGCNFMWAMRLANLYHIMAWSFTGLREYDGFDYIFACTKKGCQPKVNNPLQTVYEYRYDWTGLESEDVLVKPLGLIGDLISATCNRGDHVFDPTCFSGTTAIACNNLGIDSTVVERDRQHFDILRQRLRNCGVDYVMKR